LALALYVGLLWTGLSVLSPIPPRPPANRALRWMAVACCCLVALTIVAGGFVAGTHAGLDYNTFPLMDGRLLPEGYAKLTPWARNFTENIAAVQFDHRLLATLTVFAVVATLSLAFTGPLLPGCRIALFALGAVAVAQYVLGVATLLAVVPVTLAALHQLIAALLLTASVVVLHTARPSPAAGRWSKPGRRTT
jgi:cytochrome c oxidase assembly protein subunit 15